MLQDSVLIGSRLDASQEAATCRLALYGRLLKLLDPTDSQVLQQLKIYKLKQKQGSIDRISSDGTSAVCKGMFKKETDLSLFSGMQVWFLPWLTATCNTTPSQNVFNMLNSRSKDIFAVTKDFHNSFPKLQHAGMSISLLLSHVACDVLPACSCDCTDCVLCVQDRSAKQHLVPGCLSFS